jgi:sialate O-acetylesterase
MSSRTIPAQIYCASLAATMLLAAGAVACAQPTPGQAASAAIAKSLPFVSAIFGDNMALQRGQPETIWGSSDPGDAVRAQIGEHTASATAGVDHRWQFHLVGKRTAKLSSYA